MDDVTDGRQLTEPEAPSPWPKCPLINNMMDVNITKNKASPVEDANMGLFTAKLVHHALAIGVILLQAVCLNYYLIVLNLDDYGWVFLGWIAGDLLVVIIFIGTYYLGVQYVKRQLASQKPGETATDGPLRHMGVLPYGWLCWSVYSGVLVGKIITAFKTFGPDLSQEHIEGINLMEFTIGGTAAVFILMLNGAEQLTTNAQKHYVRWMQHYVLLEIVDCVEFLTLLFASAEGGPDSEPFPTTLQDIILTFACINLIAPALALYRLSSHHNRHPETRNRFFLSQTLVGTVFGNLPYFIVRIYLWNYRNLVTGLFTMKNLIGIVQDSRELVSYIQDVAKGRLDGSEPNLNEHRKSDGIVEEDKRVSDSFLQHSKRTVPFIDEL